MRWWNLFAAIFQIVVGIAAIVAYVIIAASGEALGKWTVTLLLAIAFMNSSYLDWNYNDPELAVAGTIMHGFEFLFVRIAPITFLASVVGIVATYKKR